MAIVEGDVHVFNTLRVYADESGTIVEVSGNVDYVDGGVEKNTNFYIGPTNSPAYVLDLRSSVADMLDADTPEVV